MTQFKRLWRYDEMHFVLFSPCYRLQLRAAHPRGCPMLTVLLDFSRSLSRVISTACCVIGNSSDSSSHLFFFFCCWQPCLCPTTNNRLFVPTGAEGMEIYLTVLPAFSRCWPGRCRAIPPNYFRNQVIGVLIAECTLAITAEPEMQIF